jgi:hypothetical protein
MVSCLFLRTKASYSPENCLKVDFQAMEVAEEIHIAAKWEKKGDDGYIGEGFTKRGIYVSIILLIPASDEQGSACGLAGLQRGLAQ